jgi:hypothetical protein
MRRAAILFLVLSAAGCYRYVPTEAPTVSSGKRVMIDLTSTGTANVRSALGDFVTSVEGRVSEANSAGMSISLIGVRRRGDSAPSTWSGETLRLASTDIYQVREHELSRSRTTLASVALGATSVAVIVAIARATGLAGGSSGRPINNP